MRFSIISSFSIFMFGKKSKNHSVIRVEKHGIQTTSMPKLQQLTTLESDLMGILGKKNISIDHDNDIFTRLQQLYLNYLQNQTLGLNLVQKCLLIVGDSDVPIRVNFLYYFAHEMKLRGAALDEIEPVLLNSFESNLNLKNKLDLGFKSGLVFCQISQHLFDTIKVINNLIVTLEEELNEKTSEIKKILKSKSMNHSRLRVQTLKSVYIGNNIVVKDPLKLPRRIELTLYLYQAYLTLMTKVESVTKLQYYSSRMSEIKKRLIRQYPGYNIQNRLSYIENYKYIALREFNQIIGVNDFRQHCKKDKAKTVPNGFAILQKMHQEQSYLKTICQNNSTINYYHIRKNSFVRQAKSSKRKASLKLELPKNQSMVSKTKNNIQQLKIRSKSKLQKKSSHFIQFQAKQPQKSKQQQKIHISRLKFGSNTDNRKLILKFNKLKEKENGQQVKKKKMKLHLHWQEKPQNIKYKVVAQNTKQNNECIQKNKSKNETKRQLSKDVGEIQQHSNLKVASGAPSHSIHKKIQINTVNLSLQQSLLEIENKFSQQDLQSQQQPNYKSAARHTESNEQINNFSSRIDQKIVSQHDSFSQTYQLNSVNDLINIRQSKQQIQEKQEAQKIDVRKKTINNLKKQHQLVCQENTIKQNNTILEQIQQNQELINIQKEEINIMIGDICKQICKNLVSIKQIEPKTQNLFSQHRCNLDGMENENKFNIQIANTKQNSSLFQNWQSKQNINCTPNTQILILQKDIQQQGNLQNQFDIFDIVDAWLNKMKVQISINQFLRDMNQQEQNQQIEEYFNDLYISIELFVILQLDGSISIMDPDVIDTKNDNKQIKIANALNKSTNKFQDQHQKIQSDQSIQYNTSNELLVINFPLTSLNTSCSDLLDDDLNLNDTYQPSKPQLPPCSESLVSMIDVNQNNPMDQKTQDNIFKDLYARDHEKQKNTNYNYLNMPTSNQELNEILSDNIHQKAMDTEQQINKIETFKTQSIQKAIQFIDPIQKQDKDDNIFSIEINRKDREENNKHKSLNIPIISFSYNQDDTITEFGQEIQHWLNPHLKMNNKAIIVTIQFPNSTIIYEKKYQIETSKYLKDSLLKKINKKLEQFLQNYSIDQYKSMNSNLWNKIVENLQDLNLLPDQVDLKIIKLEDKNENINYEIAFRLQLKDNLIKVQCNDKEIHYHPIDVAKNEGVDSLAELISPQNIFINHNELLFQGIWTLVGQKNIKFNDRYQKKTANYKFNIYQNCCKGQPISFNYCVQNLNKNLSMRFHFDGLNIRQKVIKNIQTIIGYCLKQIRPQVVIFDDSGISNLLKIL